MSFIYKVFNFVAHPTHFRTVAILALLILTAVVPITVFVSQQQQNTKQMASGPSTCDPACNSTEICKSFMSADSIFYVCTSVPAPTGTLIPTPTSTSCRANGTSCSSNDQCCSSNCALYAGSNICQAGSIPIPSQTPTPTLSLQSSSFTVIAPNGGEQLVQGKSYTIRWTSTGNPSNVRISLYESGNYKNILAAEVPDTGSWTWNTPLTLTKGSNYSIRIFTQAYPNNWDDSNNYFSIISETSILTPVPTLPQACSLKSKGDADCDNRISDSDNDIWTNEFLSAAHGIPIGNSSDFNKDGTVNTIDFNIWKTNFQDSALQH